MAGERELRLGASPGFHLPNLAGVLAGVEASEPEERRIEATYFDAPDLRLARAGASLRHRGGQGWTLALPGVEPLEFPGRAAAPPEEALRLVTAFRRSAELRPVARLSTMRRRVRLFDGSGVELSTVTDDEVSVLEGRRVAARFREVRIEAEPGAGPEIFEAVRERLAGLGAGDQAEIPVHIRALGPPAQRPSDVHLEATAGRSTAAGVLRAALAGSVESLLANDPGARLGRDPDHLRKMRVAVRRLRSHLHSFRPLLDREWTARIAGELQWLADELGAVRDLEVVGTRLRERAEEVAEPDRPTARRLADGPFAAAAAGRGRLGQVLDSERYAALLDLLVEAVAQPSLRGPGVDGAAEAVSELAGVPWRRLRRAVDGLGRAPSVEELHAVRIRAKDARYAGEATALAGIEVSPYVSALARVQAVLGEHRDSATAQEWLRSHAGSGRRGFVAGQLYQLEVAAAARALEAFPRAWKTARRGSLRKWMP